METPGLATVLAGLQSKVKEYSLIIFGGMSSKALNLESHTLLFNYVIVKNLTSFNTEMWGSLF